MSSCPWYKSGICVSPLLDQPTDIVTGRHCIDGTYTACRFYRENGKKKEGLEKIIRQNGLGYYKTNMITDNETIVKAESCECEHFSYSKVDGGIVTYCEVKDRMLTAGEGKLCILYYPTCPLRKLPANSLI